VGADSDGRATSNRLLWKKPLNSEMRGRGLSRKYGRLRDPENSPLKNAGDLFSKRGKTSSFKHNKKKAAWGCGEKCTKNPGSSPGTVGEISLNTPRKTIKKREKSWETEFMRGWGGGRRGGGGGGEPGGGGGGGGRGGWWVFRIA